jgi:hypothetical protein
VVRIGKQLRFGGTEQHVTRGWLLAGRGRHTVRPPTVETGRLDGAIDARADPEGPPDAQRVELYIG